MSEDFTAAIEQQSQAEAAAVAEAQAERAAEAAEFTSANEVDFEQALAAGNEQLGGVMAKLAARDTLPETVEQKADRAFVQRPSIGRVVHAVDVINGAERIRKADVCFVWSDDSVNLDITNHDGTHSVAEKVSFEGQQDGERIGWRWPARV